MSARRGIAAAAVTLLLSAGCTDRPATPPAADPTPTADAAPEASPLHVRLAKVTGVALVGRPPKAPLLGPAEEIRRTIERMYAAAFVDPSSWGSGFRGVLDAFASDARARARDDLTQLTLGGTARRLESVRSDGARVVVQFLPNGRRQPVAAIADMRFLATGIGPGVEVPIHHRGEYVMEPFDGRWLIVGYEVEGRIG